MLLIKILCKNYFNYEKPDGFYHKFFLKNIYSIAQKTNLDVILLSISMDFKNNKVNKTQRKATYSGCYLKIGYNFTTSTL